MLTTATRRLAQLRTFLGDGPTDKHVTVKGRPVHLSNRGPGAVMGRHGGGWDYKLGVQLGSRGLAGTVIVSLGRASVRIDPARRA